MPKNIVICSDGTGNTAIKGRGTNVFKLFEAIDLVGHHTRPQLTPQIAFYDDGVGTEDFKPVKVFAGITGYGLSRNVKHLYKALCRVYDPGDAIYMFGFSRGAFTVRTLAGLVGTCGVLDVGKLDTAYSLQVAVSAAYKTYRRKYRTALATLLLGKPRPEGIASFREAHCLEGSVPIEFIGVWDTVDAVGLPFHLSDVVNKVLYRFKFPDRTLSKDVKKACHALAIDEERHSFHPLLWDEQQEVPGRIEQVWFAGAHSNVGGGYPKQGMSLVPLDWMMAKAAASGLRFVPGDRFLFGQHANVDDKLYDPRAGLGVFYRWKPRDIAAACHEGSSTPRVHLSVFERAAHATDDYAPGNLPLGAALVFTPGADALEDESVGQRANEVESLLHSRQGDDPGRGSLLSDLPGTILVRRLGYYVYLATCVVAALAAGWPLLRQEGLMVVASPVASGVKLVLRIWSSWPLLLGLTGGLIASYLMEQVTTRRMVYRFSSFWHDAQPALRKALKRARETAADAAARASGPS
jgi:hypothetical protein